MACHGRATMAGHKVRRTKSVHEFLTVGIDDKARTGCVVKGGVRSYTLSRPHAFMLGWDESVPLSYSKWGGHKGVSLYVS